LWQPPHRPPHTQMRTRRQRLHIEPISPAELRNAAWPTRGLMRQLDQQRAPVEERQAYTHRTRAWRHELAALRHGKRSLDGRVTAKAFFACLAQSAAYEIACIQYLQTTTWDAPGVLIGVVFAQSQEDFYRSRRAARVVEHTAAAVDFRYHQSTTQPSFTRSCTLRYSQLRVPSFPCTSRRDAIASCSVM